MTSALASPRRRRRDRAMKEDGDVALACPSPPSRSAGLCPRDPRRGARDDGRGARRALQRLARPRGGVGQTIVAAAEGDSVDLPTASASRGRRRGRAVLRERPVQRAAAQLPRACGSATWRPRPRAATPCASASSSLRLSGKRAGQEREVAAALDAIIRADLPTDCTCPEERPDATPELPYRRPARHRRPADDLWGAVRAPPPPRGRGAGVAFAALTCTTVGRRLPRRGSRWALALSPRRRRRRGSRRTAGDTTQR